MLLSVGLSAVLLAASHPSAYWNAYARVSGEPVWGGRPAAYWRDDMGNYQVTAREWLPEEWAIHRYYLEYQRRRPGPAARTWGWFGRRFGQQYEQPTRHVNDLGFDPEGLAVLFYLLNDADPAVRARVVVELSALGHRFPKTAAAIRPVLRRALSDGGEIEGQAPKVTVGQLTADFAGELLKDGPAEGK